MSTQPYHALIVWKEAHQFTVELYRLTETFPSHERYGLTSQLRRAAVSIVANIVEGHAKHSKLDTLRFMDIAHGSIRECAVLLELARDISYLNQNDYDYLEEQRGRTDYLLNQFSRGIRSR